MGSLTKARGLYTYGNELNLPEGSLIQADNVFIDQNHVVTPRRGFNEYGDNLSVTSDRLKQLIKYKNRILRHFGSTLQIDNGSGTYTDFTGSYNELVDGLRIKYKEANGNLYFTTDNGIKKISAISASDITADSITDAGAPKSLNIETSTNSDITGFLIEESKVAYRTVWGYTDLNNNLLLGVPSERVVVSNSSVSVGDVNSTGVSGIDDMTSSGRYDGTTDLTYKVEIDLSLADAILLANEIKAKYELHRVDTSSCHATADNTNDITATDASDLASLITLITELLTDYDAHEGDAESGAGSYHQAQEESNHSLTSTVAPTDLPTCVTRLNDLYVKYNSHDADETAHTTGSDHLVVYSSVVSPTTDIFRWTDDDGTTWTSAVTMTGASQDLNNGVSITFGTTSGHTFSDYWTFDVSCINKSVTLEFLIPQEADNSSYFYQIYRTSIIQTTEGGLMSDIDPGDEMNLIYEANLTSTDVDEISYTDNISETFRESGTLLYTNPVSGEGIAQANNKPPIAKDIESFKESTFYANTKTRHNKTINLLSVDNLTKSDVTFSGSGLNDAIISGIYTEDDTKSYILQITGTGTPNTFKWSDDGGSSYSSSENITGLSQTLNNGLSVTFNSTTGHTLGATPGTWSFTARPSKLIIGNSTTTNEYIFTGVTSVDDNEVGVSTSSSVSNAIDETARELVNVINRNDDGIVFAYYESGEDDLPGIINFESRTLNDEIIYFGVVENIGSEFNPKIEQSQTIHDITTGLTPTITTTATHGYSAGDIVYISYNSIPALKGTFTIVTAPSTTTFTLSLSTGITGTGSVNSGILFKNDIQTENEETPNRLYFSKTGQPEAVPYLNYLDIGEKDDAIQRILALRDNLFIIKEKSTYILSGSSTPFTNVSILDNSISVSSPDTAVVLNNQIYALTTRGVVTITATGVGIISQPIEDQILKAINKRVTNSSTVSFGVSYISDKAYYLWLPTKNSDTYATQCFRYTFHNQAWTRLLVDATCGLVNPYDEKLYLGAGNANYCLQERKNDDRTDFCDLEYTLTSTAGTLSGTTIGISSLSNITVGDVLYQEQYVSISVYNRLLRKLDLDVGMEDNYYSTLEMSSGDNIITKIKALRTKVEADDSISYHTTSPTDFLGAMAEYNMITANLNSPSSDAIFNNYKTLTTDDMVFYESVITAKNYTNGTITLGTVVPFIEGTFTLFKSYEQVIEWAPQDFGDPSRRKQVSSGSVVFDGNAFYSAKLGYSSDDSRDFEDIEFLGQGIGTWGGVTWNEFVWGGEGDDKPFRTLIPRNKQRCRYISVRFKHNNSREGFKVLGISLDMRATSTRAYRNDKGGN